MRKAPNTEEERRTGRSEAGSAVVESVSVRSAPPRAFSVLAALCVVQLYRRTRLHPKTAPSQSRSTRRAGVSSACAGAHAAPKAVVA